MKKITATKTATNLVALILVFCLASCAIIESQIEHHSGASTIQVNPSEIVSLSSPLAIKNVNVLSVDSTHMIKNQTVLISKGIITGIAEQLLVGKEFTVIDGTGKYLIPGLIDSHTHLHRSKNDLLLYIALGVTHIANMNSLSDNTYIKWREEAENGALSPKIFIAGGGMTSKEGLMVDIRTYFGGSPGYNTAQQAKEAARQYKQEGYDAIKAYNLNREAYLALNEEARKIGIPIVGHLAGELTLDDLYSSGQTQLAHIEEITKATMRDFGALRASNSEDYIEYLKLNANDIAVKLKENNITVSSTLWLMESLPAQRFNTHNFLKTIALEYQNPGSIEGSWFASGWLPGENPYQSTIPEDNVEQLENAKKFTDVYIKAIHIMLGALVSNDVTILAGTDSNAPGTVAGFSLHDELESLSKAGMSNAQVLRSATLAPALWMKTNSGKIANGSRADLVLLTENPLLDIRNTKAIYSVVVDGKLLSRHELDKILSAVKKANNSSRQIDINEYLVD